LDNTQTIRHKENGPRIYGLSIGMECSGGGRDWKLANGKSAKEMTLLSV
jgi:hypothetical protein